MDKIQENKVDTIKGKRVKELDEQIVCEVNRRTDELKRIDDTRIEAVNSAYEYVTEKWEDRAARFSAAVVIFSFAFGAATVSFMWYITMTAKV